MFPFVKQDRYTVFAGLLIRHDCRLLEIQRQFNTRGHEVSTFGAIILLVINRLNDIDFRLLELREERDSQRGFSRYLVAVTEVNTCIQATFVRLAERYAVAECYAEERRMFGFDKRHSKGYLNRQEGIFITFDECAMESESTADE